MDTQQICSQIEEQRAENQAIIAYVGKLENVAPEDDALAWKLANRSVQKLGGILETCESMYDMKRLVDERYKDIVDQLLNCKKSPFSIKRFEQACVLIREAIGVSVQNDDLSCLYSLCFRIGYSILKDRPKQVRSGDENNFNSDEQEKIVAVVKPLMKELIGFGESYGLWDDDIGESVAPVYSKLRDAYLGKDRCKACLFKTNSVGQHTYSPNLFDELSVEAEMFSWVLYNPSKTDAVLRLEKVVDVFDAELEHALWIIRLPVVREFNRANPMRMRLEIARALQAVKVLARADVYRTQWVAMTAEELRLKARAAASKSMARRNGALSKLDDVQMNKREFLGGLKDLRLTLRDIDCDEVQTEMNHVQNLALKSQAKSRLRWKSAFAGRRVRGVITVGESDRDGYTDSFCVNEYKFKLTAGKAGELLDQLIAQQAKAVKKAEERQILFSKKDRNLFKGLKCVSNKNYDLNWFFKNIIHLITDEHQKIVKAEFCPDLFVR